MQKNGLRLSVSFCLIAAAGYFFIYALAAICNYGIHPLFADQWRIYTDYFNKSFPLNIFAIQNGHHPVIAGLFFLLDLKFFQGKQIFLLFVGTSLAVLTAIGLLWPTLKSHRISFFYKSAAIYIVVSGMFWLGNHRILVHANESVHAYLVTVFLLAAIAALVRCKNCRSKLTADLWCVAACVFSQLAVFSFGAGIAVPPTLFILALLARLPVGQFVILAVNMVVTALIYLVMPSASNVAGVLLASGHHLQKLINIFYLAGAPLAFLLSPQFSFMQTAVWIREYLCPIVGGLCLLGVMAKIIRIIAKKKQPVVVYNIIGLSIFSWITIVLIAVMRANYFTIYPQQVFANRYLLWSNLLWISMGLILLNEISSCPNKIFKKISVSILLIVFVFVGLWIQHNNKNKIPFLEKWSNSIQLAAASLIVGVHDDKLIVQRLREPPQEVYALAQKLRMRYLNIFSDSLAQSIDKNINVLYKLDNITYMGGLNIEKIFYDAPNHSLSARFRGWFNESNGGNIEAVLVTTSNGKIEGYAVIQSHYYSHNNNTHFQSFRGYIKDYSLKEKYRLYGIMGVNMRAIKVKLKNEVSLISRTTHNNAAVLSSL